MKSVTKTALNFMFQIAPKAREDLNITKREKDLMYSLKNTRKKKAS